jgi:hypothetical protein
MKSNNKRVSIKNLMHHVSKKMNIHLDLKSDSDISSKDIENKIEKKCGKNIEQKVPRSYIPTIVEELIDEKYND